MAITEQRAAEIETEIAQLKTQVAELISMQAQVPNRTPGKATPTEKDLGPRAVAFEQVSITNVFEENRGDQPDTAQLRQLLAIVSQAYPKLAKALDQDADGFGRFCSAYRFVRSIGRSQEVDRKHYSGFWVDEGKRWCVSRNIWPNSFRGSDICLAVIACGDIDFIQADESMGQLWEFALTLHTGDRAPSPSAWREVLAGRLRKPLPPRPPSYQVAVRQFGVGV